MAAPAILSLDYGWDPTSPIYNPKSETNDRIHLALVVWELAQRPSLVFSWRWSRR